MHMGTHLCLELFIRDDKEQKNGGGVFPTPSIPSPSQLHLSNEKEGFRSQMTDSTLAKQLP